MDASTQPMANVIVATVRHHCDGDPQNYVWVNLHCAADRIRICIDPTTLTDNAAAFEAVADRLRGIAEEIETAEPEPVWEKVDMDGPPA